VLKSAEHLSSSTEQVKIDGHLMNEFMVKDPDGHAVLLQSPVASNATASR
jgi:hypothetical protein